MRPTFKECMRDALRPVMDKHLGQPVQRVRLRLSTREGFGDAQLSPQKAFGRVFIRMILVFPIGAVALVACLTVIGLPLGIPLFVWIGSWCSKPLLKHPHFNTDGGHKITGGETLVDKYEAAYDEYEYSYEGREWK